jgi:glycosyltransferase involved in cell wall biosynthesis
MTELLGVSIVITNYNNERFLAAAIDSALGQDHPVCELIVVDDCSTDNSRVIISSYADRFQSVFRETNGGHTAALNSAWRLAKYPILIILDSDDVLFAHAASTIASSWTTATVKIQFPLATIDATGRQLGHVAPKFPPNLDTAVIRAALLRTCQSPSVQGSGNAYSRSLLDWVDRDGGFEVGDPRELTPDQILECNAPFYGEVITLFEPLAFYRIHDSNESLLHTIDYSRFAKGTRYCLRKLDYFEQRCSRWGIPFDAAAASNRSTWLLDCRLAVNKLAPANDPSRAPISTILYHGLKAHIKETGPRKVRILQTLWFVSVALSPRRLSIWLIALRFIVAQRPQWFARMFNRFA